MATRPGKSTWGIYVPIELAERVKKYCRDDKRTLTYVVLESVDKFLKERGY